MLLLRDESEGCAPPKQSKGPALAVAPHSYLWGLNIWKLGDGRVHAALVLLPVVVILFCLLLAWLCPAGTVRLVLENMQCAMHTAAVCFLALAVVPTCFFLLVVLADWCSSRLPRPPKQHTR